MKRSIWHLKANLDFKYNNRLWTLFQYALCISAFGIIFHKIRHIFARRGKRVMPNRQEELQPPWLKKSADTGERNVDIIRNIRDALKVIRFHMGASVGQSIAVAERGGDWRESGFGKREKGREIDRERERARENETEGLDERARVEDGALSGCQGPLPWPLFPLCRVFSGFNHPLASSAEAMAAAATAMSPAYWQSRNWTSGTRPSLSPPSM